MTLRTASAAFLLGVPVEHLLAAIERGDLTRPLSSQRLGAVYNARWVVEGRDITTAQRRASDAKAEARVKEESAREDRRSAAYRLRIPLRAVTAAAKRGDIPATPTYRDVARLLEEMPHWLRYARCAVAAGEPNRATTLAGIDDPETRAAIEMLAGLHAPRR